MGWNPSDECGCCHGWLGDGSNEMVYDEYACCSCIKNVLGRNDVFGECKAERLMMETRNKKSDKNCYFCDKSGTDTYRFFFCQTLFNKMEGLGIRHQVQVQDSDSDSESD